MRALPLGSLVHQENAFPVALKTAECDADDQLQPALLSIHLLVSHVLPSQPLPCIATSDQPVFVLSEDSAERSACIQTFAPNHHDDVDHCTHTPTASPHPFPLSPNRAKMLLALWRSGMHPVMLAGGDNKDCTVPSVTTQDGVGHGCDSGSEDQDGLDSNAATATRATTPAPMSPSGPSNGGTAGRDGSLCFDAEIQDDYAACKIKIRKEGLDLVPVAVCDVGGVSHAMKLRERCSNSPRDLPPTFPRLSRDLAHPPFPSTQKKPSVSPDLKSSSDPNPKP